MDLAKKIFHQLKIKPKISYYGIQDNRSYFVDFSLSRKLGFECTWTIHDGINELMKKISFFKKFNDDINYPVKHLKKIFNLGT